MKTHHNRKYKTEQSGELWWVMYGLNKWKNKKTKQRKRAHHRRNRWNEIIYNIRLEQHFDRTIKINGNYHHNWINFILKQVLFLWFIHSFVHCFVMSPHSYCIQVTFISSELYDSSRHCQIQTIKIPTMQLNGLSGVVSLFESNLCTFEFIQFRCQTQDIKCIWECGWLSDKKAIWKWPMVHGWNEIRVKPD